MRGGGGWGWGCILPSHVGNNSQLSCLFLFHLLRGLPDTGREVPVMICAGGEFLLIVRTDTRPLKPLSPAIIVRGFQTGSNRNHIESLEDVLTDRRRSPGHTFHHFYNPTMHCCQTYNTPPPVSDGPGLPGYSNHGNVKTLFCDRKWGSILV